MALTFGCGTLAGGWRASCTVHRGRAQAKDVEAMAIDTDAVPSARMSASAARRWPVTAYALLAVLMTTSAFYGVFADPEITASTSKASGNSAYALLWLLLYGTTALLLGRGLLLRGLHPRALAALPLMGLIVASALWSAGAGTTVFYGGMLCANVLIAYVLAQELTLATMTELLARVLAVLLMLSLAAFVVTPELAASERWGGGWLTSSQLHGVFAHKSDAAYYFGMLLLILMFAPHLRLVRGLRVALVMLALLAIVLANSATALAGVVVIAALATAMNRYPQLHSLIMAIAAASAIALSVLVPFLDIGFTAALVGRDEELTGRADIWASAPHFMATRPLLGYGYYGFFDTGPDSPARQLWDRSEWFKTPHFHNSALDTAISLGAIGLLLYVIVLSQALGVARSHAIALRERTLLGSLMLLLTISATFDFTFMRHNSFATTFLFFCLFSARGRAPVVRS
jgi:O-antigen ligase